MSCLRVDLGGLLMWHWSENGSFKPLLWEKTTFSQQQLYYEKTFFFFLQDLEFSLFIFGGLLIN